MKITIFETHHETPAATSSRSQGAFRNDVSSLVCTDAIGPGWGQENDRFSWGLMGFKGI
jgi:urease accessory protein UreH